MEKGILLIALGHKNYYRMAFNLALSIKANDEIPIALVNDGSIRIDNALFDHSIILQPAKEDIIKTKTLIYDLSPFDETIFLDVDMIMLKGRKISPLFDTLKPYSNWTMANTGIAGTSIWADINLIKKKYKGDMWNYHSEFIYFKKSEAAKQYFDKVKEVYENEDVEAIKAIKFSNGRMADELAFQLASMQLNQYPHKQNFLPTFWHHRERKYLGLYLYQLPEQYIFYSIGGNTVPRGVANNYNTLASVYNKRAGLQSFYKAQNKRSFLPERQKV